MTENTGAAFGLTGATAPLDPSTWNLDDWIDEVTRPTEIVRLYGKGHLNERLKEIEREMRLLERRTAQETSIADEGPSLASLQEEWDLVAVELKESERAFRVQALTSDEEDAAIKRAKAAKESESDQILHVIAAAVVEPKGVTPEKLKRFRAAGGDAGLALMYAVIKRLGNNTVQPSVPFSPRPSGGTRG